MGCGCLNFLETANQKTLFVLSIILLVFGAFHFFFAEDPIIGFALGIIACFLAILGLFGAWRKDSKTLVIYMVLVCFLLVLELVSIAFQTLGDEPSFTSLVMGVLSVIYYFLCVFFAWRIHRQEGYQIQI
eukprot:TRINITY_DN3833_c0_g1_i1.p1 TRINITY_DN3833_c0_g1~~TRINITY_DN3833_c0_g1_i1.p1  ORF type:complete len:130 (+),score=3.87 TRINITY_DN3833_c0_g1_i1:250-639(+)